MPAYRLNEAEVEIPKGWKDLSVNSFVLPGDDASGSANLVISRDPDAPAGDVEHYADSQMVEAAKQFKNYKLVSRKVVEVDGAAAVECTYTWTTAQRVTVQQRQLCVRHDPVFLIITLSAKVDAFPRHEPAWSSVIRSLKLS